MTADALQSRHCNNLVIITVTETRDIHGDLRIKNLNWKMKRNSHPRKNNTSFQIVALKVTRHHPMQVTPFLCICLACCHGMPGDRGLSWTNPILPFRALWYWISHSEFLFLLLHCGYSCSGSQTVRALATHLCGKTLSHSRIVKYQGQHLNSLRDSIQFQHQPLALESMAYSASRSAFSQIYWL